MRRQVKDILLKRIEEHRGSPEFVATLRQADVSRSRISVNERFAAPLATAKRSYLEALDRYIAAIKGFAADSSLSIDASSIQTLRLTQATTSQLVERRHIEFARARFDIHNASLEAERVCREFTHAGGFGCRFPEPDHGAAERHLKNLNVWKELVDQALLEAIESGIEARKSEVRKQTLAFEASAAFLVAASSSMRAYMEGPELVSGAEVYVTYLPKVEALLSIPCEEPAPYQVSGCKTVATQIESARAFREALPRYVRNEVPAEVYSRIRSLPLEEQVARHEAYVRTGR